MTDLTVNTIFFIGESVKRKITDSISKNLTDSDLESTVETKRFILLSSLFESAISQVEIRV